MYIIIGLKIFSLYNNKKRAWNHPNACLFPGYRQVTCTSTSKGWSTPLGREPPLSLFSMCENWRYSETENKSRESSILLCNFTSFIRTECTMIITYIIVAVKIALLFRDFPPLLTSVIFYHRHFHLFLSLTLCYLWFLCS